MMEQIEFRYEMQGWHPQDVLGKEQLTRIYMSEKNSDYVIFMITVKTCGDNKRITNTYVSDRYKGMRDKFGEMAFNKLK